MKGGRRKLETRNPPTNTLSFSWDGNIFSEIFGALCPSVYSNKKKKKKRNIWELTVPYIIRCLNLFAMKIGVEKKTQLSEFLTFPISRYFCVGAGRQLQQHENSSVLRLNFVKHVWAPLHIVVDLNHFILVSTVLCLHFFVTNSH